jgi:hypothetical protein
MANPAEHNDNRGDTAASNAVQNYVKGLSPEHRMLIVLKAQLYDGGWDAMLEDLQNRLVGKPYIFKLAGRIEQDIERIRQMQQFEKEHGADLASYVDSVD